MNIYRHTIIIGGGPAGSSAAIYLARFNYPVTLIDAKDTVHGRTAMATNLKNYLGHEKVITGKVFLKKVYRQLKKYPIKIVNEKVLKVTLKNSIFEVFTDTKNQYQSKYLIVAVGLSDNMPEIEGLDPYYDTAIFHCSVCDWYQNRHKKIAVVGNDDDTIKMAIDFKTREKNSILTVIPSKKPNFSELLKKKASSYGIKVYLSPIKELIGKNSILEALKLSNNELAEAEAIFTNLGYSRFDHFLDVGNLKPERNKDGYIKVNFKTFESSISNLFAVGPCNEGPAQAIIAGGEGAMAAIEIDKKILN